MAPASAAAAAAYEPLPAADGDACRQQQQQSGRPRPLRALALALAPLAGRIGTSLALVGAGACAGALASAVVLRPPQAHAASLAAGTVPEALSHLPAVAGTGVSSTRFLAGGRQESGDDVRPHEVLEWLRGQDFNLDTEGALLDHPLVLAAEKGTMPLLAMKLVLLEEYSIESSDLRSMAAALARFGGRQASRDFFLSSADGEKVAYEKLRSMAKVLNMSEATLAAYQPMPEAHAYSAYLAQLSNYGGAAAIAAGFAVNFPTWGRMCGRIRDALLRPPYGFAKDEVEFLTYFAEPVPGFDESAAAVIAEGMASGGETAGSIRSAVMLLQGYERMFWDAVWAKATAVAGANRLTAVA